MGEAADALELRASRIVSKTLADERGRIPRTSERGKRDLLCHDGSTLDFVVDADSRYVLDDVVKKHGDSDALYIHFHSLPIYNNEELSRALRGKVLARSAAKLVTSPKISLSGQCPLRSCRTC